MQYLENLIRLGHPQYKNQPIPGDILAETKAIVEKYRDDIALYGKNVEKLAELYRNIGQRYLDIGYFRQQIPTYLTQIAAEKNIREQNEESVYNQALGLWLEQKGLYQNAYEYFSKSLAISLNSERLYYKCGFCAAGIAKAEKLAGAPGSDAWFEKAEQYYNRAVEIDPDYVEAHYGLAIIYVYELDRPGAALPHLLRIKEIQKSNIENLFVLAAAYFQLGEYNKAILEYDAIETTSNSEEIKNQARANKERILKEYNGE